MMIPWLRHLAMPLFRWSGLTRARRGQATIMFALMAVPMIGMLGLVVDGGVYLYARRTTQAAADAAALAGARQLSKSNAAQADVVTVATANGQGGINPTIAECVYVDKNGGDLSPCVDSPPATASGVRVRAAATVPTFFMPVIPAAPTSMDVAASAAALVQRTEVDPGAAPLIVCGNLAKLTSGSLMNIVESTDPFTIRESAVGETFVIHDANLAEADCSAQGNSFKGVAGQNAGKQIPGWIVYESGNEAGPTGQSVMDGCWTPVQQDTCVMLLPLATNDPPPKKTGSVSEIYVYGFAAFEVTRVDANTHHGTLLGSYIISGPGAGDWTQDDGGVVTVRLTG